MKKRFQQLIDTLLKRGKLSAQDRSTLNSEEQSIVDAAKLLIASRHENTPYRMEFKQELQKKILALHTQKAQKRKKTKKTVWRALHIKTLAGTGIGLMAVAAVVAFSLFQQTGLIDIIKPGESGGILIPAAFAHDNFTITPEVVDEFGVIAQNTDFVVQSQARVAKNDLEQYLKLSNGMEYTLTTIRRGYEYKIDPVSDLEPGQILQVSAATIVENEESLDPFTYQWVFEVADHFSIQSTSPGDRSIGIATNRAIEIMLSHAKTEDLSAYLTIQPNHSVRIEQDFRTIRLIPETPWQDETLYTVTIKNGFGVQSSFIPAEVDESEWRLQSDYSFAFTTGSGLVPTGSFTYLSKSLQSKPNEQVSVNGYGFRISENAPLQVKIHRLDPTVIDQVAAQTTRLDGWVPTEIVTSESRQILQTFGLTNPLVEYSIDGEDYFSQKQFALNALQNEGVYLVEAEIAGQTDLLFWSVSSLGAYIVMSETGGLVWVVDTDQNQPKEGVAVYANDQLLGTSDQEGIVAVSAEQLMQFEQSEVFKLVEGTQTTLHSVKIWQDLKDVRPEYNGFFHLDQYLVHPEDTVNYWGLVDRVGADVTEIEVEITLWGSDFGSYSNVIVHKERVEVNEQGFFTGSIVLQDLRDGYYTISIHENGHYFTEQAFEVTEFATPELSIAVNPEHQRIDAGESNLITISTARFDGSPARFIDLSISGDYEGIVSTDELGQAQISVPSAVADCFQYGCNTSDLASVRITPIGSYETEIFGAAYWTVSQDYTDITINLDETESEVAVVARARGVEYLTNDEQYPSNDEKKFHIAQGVPFEARVFAISSERSELVSEVNPLTNATEYYYTFTRSEDVVGFHEGLTNEQGEISFSFTKLPNTNYRVSVRVLDRFERYDLENAYLTNYSLPFGKVYVENETDEPSVERLIENQFPNEELWLEALNDDTGYQVGDSIEVEAILGEGELNALPENNPTLFFTMSPNISEYFVTNARTQSIPVLDTYLPNVHIGAATILNGSIYYTSYYFLDIQLESDPYELDITVETEKDEYSIQDEVQADITVTDKNGNPVETLVNISVLDKAYLELDQFAGNQNPLNSLFAPQYERIVINTATHNATLGPDGLGGGGGGDRSRFLEQASYQFIQTDRNGKGSVSFILPDNITSWAIVATTGTRDFLGGLGKKEIRVAQSFVVQAIQSDSYIVGDDIVISARNYSTEVPAQSDVTYSFYGPLPKEEEKRYELGDFPVAVQQQTIPAIEVADFPVAVDAFGEYVYAIRAIAGENEDTIIKSFNFSPGRATSIKQQVEIVNEGWAPQALDDAIGRVSVRFASPLGATAYQALSSLPMTASRLDYVMAQSEISEIKQQYFDFSSGLNDSTIRSEYKNPNGGYARFPFGESDLAVTSSIATLLENDNRITELGDYFRSVMESEVTPNEAALALRGLAAMNEPAYAQLKSFAANESLSVEEKIFLADAFTLYGDYQEARRLLEEILLSTTEENGQRFFMGEGINDPTQMQWYSELARVIAFTLADDSWGEFDSYITAQNDIVDPIAFTRFWKLRLERQPITDMSFVIVAGEEEQFVTLQGFESFGVNVTKEELASLSVESVRGNVQVLYQYEVSGQEPQLLDGVRVTRTYSQGGGGVDVVNQDEEVDVAIVIEVSSPTAYGTYALTDVLPSGLQAITRGGNWGADFARCERPVYKTSLHIAKSFVVLDETCSRIVLTYKARTVATAGSSVVEGIRLVNLDNPSLAFIGPESKITIE